MNNIAVKRIYNKPTVELIKLDNEISLILESSNSDPGEPGYVNSLEYFNNDPCKNNIG